MQPLRRRAEYPGRMRMLRRRGQAGIIIGHPFDESGHRYPIESSRPVQIVVLFLSRAGVMKNEITECGQRVTRCAVSHIDFVTILRLSGFVSKEDFQPFQLLRSESKYLLVRCEFAVGRAGDKLRRGKRVVPWQATA